jgi:hypothetical protein
MYLRSEIGRLEECDCILGSEDDIYPKQDICLVHNHPALLFIRNLTPFQGDSLVESVPGVKPPG